MSIDRDLKISVCMIVKNEESCLEKCLSSVKEADEIVILDTGSSDKTEEIARKYTDKCYFREYEWEDSFCKARNKALSKVTGDWIISIDADEYLEVDHIKKIREDIKKAEKLGKKTIDVILTADRTREEHYFPRIFKKCPEVFWQGNIHNYLNIAEHNRSSIVIYYGYSLAHQTDPDRAFRILKKEVETNSKCTREKYYLAREYYYRKDYEKAIEIYKLYLEVAYWAPEMADANLMLARCYRFIGKFEEARMSCLNAIKINTNFKEALLMMAEMSGPGNKKRWLEFASTATNEGILFIRV